MKHRRLDPPTPLQKKYRSLPRNWNHAEKMRVLVPKRRSRRDWIPRDDAQSE
jgi:hypothetical protein